MSIVSMVENAKATSCKQVDADNFVQALIARKWRDKIETIRQAYHLALSKNGANVQKASNAIRDLKSKLPGVLWAGIFRKRSVKGISVHSGLLVIDLDHLGSGLNQAKAKLTSDSHVFSCFVSPSGDGLKVVLKVPPEIENHAASWATAAKRVESLTGIKPDNGNDLARLCFVSYDSSAYHNPKALELEVETEKVICNEIYPSVLKANVAPIDNLMTDTELIERAINADNGSKFKSLWDGVWQGEYKSQNEADAGLLGLLRFWTSGNKLKSFSLFSKSGLSRDKWNNREDYTEATWAKIVNGETHKPQVALKSGLNRTKILELKIKLHTYLFQ